MNNLGILIKNNLNIAIGKFQGKKKRASTMSATILFIILIIGSIALYSFQAWTMFDGLGSMGLGKLCIFHACSTTVSVLAILGIMRASATQASNDQDMLLAMPIKKSDIILSKLINKYLFDFFFVAMLFVPYIIIYQIRDTFNSQVLFMGLILTFILPLFSIGISHVFDYIFTRLFSKSRFSKFLKSIATTIIYIIILITLLISTSSYGTNTPATMNDYFKRNPPANLLLQFMFSPTLANVLLVLLITVVPFIVGFILYILTLGKPTITYTTKDKTLKFKANKSPFNLLMKKEFYNYLSSPAYLINTIIGVILILVIGIFVAATGKSGLTSLFGGFLIPNDLLAGIAALIFCFASSTVFITAPSISLEGKSFWFLKSQPVSANSILLSKLLLHILITIPAIIISSTLMSICLGFNLIEFAIVFALPILHAVIMAFAGLLLNLWLPNFDWDNETMVVKQSMPSLFAMILGMLLSAGIIGLYLLLDTYSILIIFAAISSIYLFVAIILGILTFTLGKKLYNRI